MTPLVIIVILFAAGILVLIAELFLPSHGVLSVVGIGLLIAGIVQTYRYAGEQAAALATIACLIGLPLFAFGAIRIWPRTWVGRRIAPPNPTFSARDTSIPVDEINRYIGATGQCLTPLRPVGVCEFQGRRIACIAEFGMIDSGTTVEGVRLAGGNLAVRPRNA